MYRIYLFRYFTTAAFEIPKKMKKMEFQKNHTKFQKKMEKIGICKTFPINLLNYYRWAGIDTVLI